MPEPGAAAHAWVALAVGGVLAAVCLFFALRAARRRRLIQNLPTCKTTGVFIGLVEVQGTAESEVPLWGYLSERACVWYRWRIEEHWSRTVTETYRDSKGRTQTRTRRESGWKTVDSGGESSLFYVRDEAGVVRVDPEGAKIEPQQTFSVQCAPVDALYYGKGPAEAVAHSDHQRRFVEEAVPLHAPVYVIGQARERKDVIAPEIAADPRTDLFLVSTRDEHQVSAGMHVTTWLVALLGLGVALGGAWVYLALLDREIPGNVPLLVLTGLAYVGAWVTGWVWMVYNSMVDLRQRVAQAWANIDVQLQRRADLIPNLVKTVEALRDHEAGTQTALAQLRGQLGATGPGLPGPDPQACATVLRAVAERYPELKANDGFLHLQRNLVETENRLALARSYFNEIATHYNARLQTVPDRFVAGLGRMRPQLLLGADNFERAPVTVKLAT